MQKMTKSSLLTLGETGSSLSTSFSASLFGHLERRNRLRRGWIAAVMVAAAVGLTSFAATARAQDVVVLTSGQRLDGKILGVSGGNIRIQRGPAQSSIPLNTVRSTEMAPPPEFVTGQASLKSGDTAKALQTLKPLVDTFRGLPTPWAEQASAQLGDLYIRANKLPEAQQAYTEFSKAYPNASNLTNVGLARLAVANKDLAGAKPRIQPLVEQAKKTKYADEINGAAFGQALLLMGQIDEAEGRNTEALENYLTTVTIFYQDPDAATQAQARADTLRKEKKVIAP